MSSFDSTKTQLSRLLQEIVEGKIQLPDFQRGWVWDDEHIRSLLVSIARSFPIGAVMLLETGGEARFRLRPVEGVDAERFPADVAEQLILDGQQRLTSLTQVLKLGRPVATRDEKKRELKLHYYFDIEKALLGPESLEDSILAVGEDKTTRSDFGRKIEIDVSSVAKEVATFLFPCSQILDSSQWEYELMQSAPDRFQRYMEFRSKVLDPFRSYLLPVITLKRSTSKEAVCLVFEKVNTGGVPLSVFELVTATWAADGFHLRDDWLGTPTQPGRHTRLSRRSLLKDVQPTDFLQGISLLYSQGERERDIAAGKTGKAVSAVTAKREHILALPLTAYQKWAEPLTAGFEQAERFLRREGFHHPKFLPYRSQLPPLAALLARLGDRWLEPRIKDRLSRWYWSGVLGELYGGAIESRMALDLQQLVDWIENPDALEPATVQAASFNPNRLDTLRSRTSAAYRGLYVLLQREGAKDFFWKTKMVELDGEEIGVDIHHIFPAKWCDDAKIPPRVRNSIVNKTAISYKANRMIGGKAPSAYLAQIQGHAQVGLSDEPMDDVLRTHLIEPALLRANNFDAFYAARKQSLLTIVAGAMGKSISAPTGQTAAADGDNDDDDDLED